MKTMNHSEYIAKTKKMSVEELKYALKDAREAMEAMPYGENASYYADEVNYCAMELKRRQDGTVKRVGPICYGQTIGRDFCQEWYETSSRDASKRTRECRKVGFKAFSSPMGEQVTNVGKVRMTLVSIYFDISVSWDDLPSVRIEN